MAAAQTTAMESSFTKLEELRRVCDSQTAANQQKVVSAVASFGKSLQSLRSKAEKSARNQVELTKLKAQLRELEDELVKALAVKTRKEAKRMAIIDSLSETRVKVAELHKIVQDQAARKEEYEAILSRQLKVLMDSKEKSKQASKHREEMQEAFSWYNRVLGFRIDGGHGVKFTFTNIDRKHPEEEYSFTIRHSNDVYTLLDCNPHLNGTEELVKELNKSNGLFKFVGVMREKFQAAASGSISHYIYQDQDTTSVSLSAPVSSVSVASIDKSSPPLREANGNVTKVFPVKGAKSPMSAASVRRSPRFVAQQPEH